MRIGIITKHGIFNYGSFMQAYGTQRALEKLGHDVEIIDYQYPNPFHATHKSLKGKFLHWANYTLKNLLPGRPGKSWVKAYNDCFNKHYKLSKHYASQEEIMQNPPEYDVYVAGSDQLWRPKFTNGDPVFFADFAPKGKKRISYASSFGCLSIPEQHKANFGRMLREFSHIAVREKSGINLVKDLSGKEATLVADPTLLLNADEWRAIMQQPRIKKPYVICYGNKAVDYINDVAKKLVGDRDLMIVRTNGNFTDYFNKDIHHILDVGPLEWLGLLANADFVLAGSFHGTAFSIQFHRPFMSVLIGDNDHDLRQLNLLEELGLENHALYIGDPDIDKIQKNINNTDWDKTDSRIKSLRESSLEYLKQAIEL